MFEKLGEPLNLLHTNVISNLNQQNITWYFQHLKGCLNTELINPLEWQGQISPFYRVTEKGDRG